VRLHILFAGVAAYTYIYGADVTRTPYPTSLTLNILNNTRDGIPDPSITMVDQALY
jgi:hypothetical protein